MKVSIITPTYNSAATLGDTLESILGQTYKDLECIVVDGASADATLEIIKDYEPRFGGRLRWVSEKDRGLYDAMNKGLAMATGDVVGVLNSDDIFFDNGVIADVAKTFEQQRPECIYGDLKFVDAADTSRVVREWKGSQYVEGAFRRGWHPAHPTFYALRSCYERYGGFDLGLRVSADFDLMLRFIGKHKLRSVYVPRDFIWMRAGGESNGSLRRILQGNRNILRAFRKNGYAAPPFYMVRRLAPKVWNMMKFKCLHAVRRGK